MDIVFAGAGRLATHLARALHKRGHNIMAVYSRTMASARELCEEVGGTPTDRCDHLPRQADAFIVAVTDTALPTLLPLLAEGRREKPFFHTAGSVPMSVLEPYFINYGVIYPMQTFSKECSVDFAHLPIFLEACNDKTLRLAHVLASSVSDQVQTLSSQQRRYLHLAAVLACNFANHCYTLAADVLEEQGMDFSIMLPLIQATARKVTVMHPRDAQTGPAVRYDQNIIDGQCQLLAGHPTTQDIYRLMSNSIHEHCL